MKIEVLIQNIALEASEIEERKVYVDKNTTIQELLNSINCEIADLSEYYEFSGVFAWNTVYLPYIISNNKILYDVPYSEAYVFDFIKTHGIQDSAIRIVTGYPQAGGPGFIELSQLWEQIYPILEQIELLLSLGAIAVGTAKKLCNLFKKRKRTPQVCFDIVFSRNRWNHFELSDYLHISNMEAKNLLMLCGYEYNHKQLQYIKSNRTDELKQKLTDVQVYDI